MPRVCVLLDAPGRISGCLRSAAAACPHTLLCGDAPDAVPKGQDEPQVAIGAGCDAERPATDRGDVELVEAASSGDPPNVADNGFRKPQAAIGPGRDPLWQAALCGNRELGEATTGRDAPDLVPITLGKPEVAVRSGSGAPLARYSVWGWGTR